MSVRSIRCQLGRRLAVSFIAAPSIAGMAMFGGLAGCASTALDAQWADAQLPPRLLRGAKVMVLCEAQDVVIQRLCQDQIVAGLTQRGAVAVAVPENINVPIAQVSIDPQLLGAARDAGATAVFSVVVSVSSQAVSPGVSIGIGGFGFGGHSGVGVGVSAPIGGGKVNAGYAANGRVTAVASARLLWTARATAPPSSNVTAQLSELSATVLAAADKAGMF
jgi:hypothetical protein